MASQLPEIKLTCKNGHTFPTRARGGVAVACPECRRQNPGQPRVTRWVPKDRPRTERERAGLPATAPEPDPGLTARWAREPAWSGKIPMAAGRPGDECPGCGEALMWEPGRTVIYCSQCPRLSLPPAVAEHYEHQERRTAAVATRTTPDAAAKRAARVRLAALKTRMTDQVDNWLNELDPDELTGPVERMARDYQAELSAYLTEIKNAASEAELTEILADITEVLGRAEAGGVLDAIERHRQAVERQADEDERQAELAAQAEQEAEQERQEARRQAQIQASAQRRAIAPPPAARKPVTGPPTGGYVGAAVTVIGMMEARRQEKEKAAARLAQVGQCQYQHRKPVAPDRRYYISAADWSGNANGYEIQNSPAVLACRKHFAEADTWIEEQAAPFTRQGYNIKTVYQELT